MRTAFALPALMLLHSSIVGCPTRHENTPATDDAKQREIAAHLVVVDSLGRIDYVANGLARTCSVRRHWNSPEFRSRASSRRSAVDQFRSKPYSLGFRTPSWPNQADRKDILFYFNGGMNATSDVIKQANDQYGAIQRDGYLRSSSPGRPEPLRSYLEQFINANGLYSEAPATVTGTSRMVSDILVGAARAPGDWALQLPAFPT